MNWKKVYHNLMARAKLRLRPDCYCEKHHIIPKSIGGADTPDNLVWLTAREHLIAHRLWARFENNDQFRRKAQNALWAMVTMRGKDNAGRVIPNSRVYEEAKVALRNSKIGRVVSAEAREKISKTLSSHFKQNGSHNKGRSYAHMSDDERKKLFGSKTRGRVQSQEEKEKRALKLRKPRSEEAKKNIRLGALKREAAKKAARLQLLNQ